MPVYGIGAGPDTDGQLLIVSDLVGQFQAFTPKFVKKYCDVAQVYIEAFSAYIRDVKANAFPEDQHCYHIIKGEEQNFAEMLKKFG
jgi:3-methyl-2-oxobutanoate hydroxymethyltransferase